MKSNPTQPPHTERQAQTIPPVIRKNISGNALTLFRTKRDGKDVYSLELNGDVLFEFNDWQYHALCAMFSFGGDKYDTLLVNINDRFGLQLSQYNLDMLFDSLRQKKLFDDVNALKHPLTAPFCSEEGVNMVMQPHAPAANGEAEKPKASLGQVVIGHIKALFSEPEQLAALNEEKKSHEPANDAEAKKAERTHVFKLMHVFNPTRLLIRLKPALLLGKYALFPLPFMLFYAVFSVLTHPEMVAEDLPVAIHSLGIIGHLLFGLITVSAFSTFATAAVVHCFGATVKSISVIWYFGFIPRFVPRLEDFEKFTRRQRLWVHATPLLMRLALFSGGVMLWQSARSFDGAITQFGSVLAVISFLSFVVAACPFLNGNGYRFMVDLLDQKRLRGRAVKALLNKFNKNSYGVTDANPALTAYAMTCLVFVLALVSIVFAVTYNLLSLEIGLTSIFVVGAIITAFVLKFLQQVRKINEAYHKNQQFERWRDRTLIINENIEEKAGNKANYKKRLAIVSFCLLMLVPYQYQPSGRIELLPAQRQQLSTDIAGMIDKVYYDGGEYLEQGTVIATLGTGGYQAQLDIMLAKRAVQEAVIANLKSQPTREDVLLAEERLELANIRAEYSVEACERQQKLFKSGSISLDKMAAAESLCEVDKQRVLEAEAELEKVLAGVPAEQIAVAEAELLPIEAQISLYEDYIARSTFRMPFDGKLAALNLKERQGDFLDLGEPLAMVQDDSSFKAIVEVPETDLEHVREGADVSIRMQSYPGNDFVGKVEVIEPQLEDDRQEKVVRMLVSFEQDQNLLRSGMTGYAKVSGYTVMVWQTLTKSLYRFFTVELWAWAS